MKLKKTKRYNFSLFKIFQIVSFFFYKNFRWSLVSLGKKRADLSAALSMRREEGRNWCPINDFLLMVSASFHSNLKLSCHYHHRYPQWPDLSASPSFLLRGNADLGTLSLTRTTYLFNTPYRQSRSTSEKQKSPTNCLTSMTEGRKRKETGDYGG